MRITETILQELNACPSQVSIFAAEWPDGCEISIATLNRAIELELDVNWLANRVLRGKALKLYKETCETARKLCDEACAKAQKLCDEKCETALRLYDEVCAPARKLCDDMLVLAFLECLKLSDCQRCLDAEKGDDEAE